MFSFKGEEGRGGGDKLPREFWKESDIAQGGFFRKINNFVNVSNAECGVLVLLNVQTFRGVDVLIIQNVSEGGMLRLHFLNISPT